MRLYLRFLSLSLLDTVIFFSANSTLKSDNASCLLKPSTTPYVAPSFLWAVQPFLTIVHPFVVFDALPDIVWFLSHF